MRKLILFLAAVSLVLFAEKALCYETTFPIEPEAFNSFRYQEMRAEEAAPPSIRTGWFLSVDPGKDRDPKKPQSWNTYAYVRNNPINNIDPTGKVTFGSGETEQLYKIATESISDNRVLPERRFLSSSTCTEEMSHI